METEKITNWLDEELANTNTPTDFEKLEPLKLETGKITKFVVDFSTPFKKWPNPDGTVKAIIPVTHKFQRKNLWLNVKNPLYRQIVEKGKSGQKEFTVSTVGTQKDTRYTIVEED